MTTPPADQTPPTNQVPWTWQLRVAIGVLFVFALLCLFMILNAGVEDRVWKNLMAVFGAVQAIVFTAVGWLFGREVNRGEVASAKQNEAEAKEGAAQARQDKDATAAELAAAKENAATEKQRGEALVAAVESGMAGGGPAQPPGGQSRDVGAQQPRGDGLRDFARRLYPELYEPR